MRRAALHNLGCKVNAYETEAMQQILEKAGYEIVPFQEQADVYVINTCSVTNMADRKSRQMIHRARKQNPDAVIVAAGCYVQTAGERQEEDETIDIVIGNNKKHELAERLEEFFEKHEKARAMIDINCQKEGYEELSLSRTAEHTRAFIKVQDGCNQFCTYCIIPYARGRVRSRKPADVLDEIQRLAENGYQEVVLTGIHLSSYGIDIEDDLLHLIEQVHEIEGIQRIRLGSLEPKIVTEKFAKRLSELEKICPHFHLSLQSGCDATLERMNRKYTTEEYAKSCGYLRKYFRQPAITTDVIVGFPGETEEEFAELENFAKEVRFERVGCFAYSQEENTPAAKLEPQIPENVKERRAEIIMENQQEIMEEFCQKLDGKTIEVLVEGYDQYAECFFGRSAWDAPEVDGSVFFTVTGRKPAPGEFVKVKIDDFLNCDPIGEMVE